jgi:hypothetical protein
MTGPVPADQAEALASAHAAARQRAEAGDLTGARTLIEDALANGELLLGPEDPRLVPLMVDLATLARKLGNLTEARNQLRRAYAIIVASAGPEHATSLSIEGRLAAVIYRLGEPTEAYDWHLADAGSRVLGAEHPAVRGAQQRLAASAHGGPTVVPAAPPPIGWTDSTPDILVDGEGWAAPPEGSAYAPVTAGVYQRQPEIHVIPPPPGPDAQDVQVWREPPITGREIGVRQRRGHGGGVALVASLGVIVLIAAAVVAVQFFTPATGTQPGADPTGNVVHGASPPTGTPSPTAPPPTGVTIKDEGGSVTLTWEDPGGGRIPFIVSGGREGTPLMALDSVPAGRTTSTIYGLNERFNYCFTVSAVWASDKITPSIRTCTYRLSTSSAP